MNLKGFFRVLFEPVSVKKTGYEELSDQEFLELAIPYHPFRSRMIRTMLTANWSALFSDDLLKAKELKQFWTALTKRTSSKSIFELGVNKNALSHRRIACNKLKATSYQGIDAYFDGPHVTQADALTWLVSQTDSSGSVLAFGLLNEPLSPEDSFVAINLLKNGFILPVRDKKRFSRSPVEHEYLRRLAKNIYRVVPDDGILFGCGLYPMGFRRDMRNYLEQQGFNEDIELLELLTSGIRSREARGIHVNVRQPFFFVKKPKGSQ